MKRFSNMYWLLNAIFSWFINCLNISQKSKIPISIIYEKLFGWNNNYSIILWWFSMKWLKIDMVIFYLFYKINNHMIFNLVTLSVIIIDILIITNKGKIKIFLINNNIFPIKYFFVLSDVSEHYWSYINPYLPSLAKLYSTLLS